VEAGQKCTHFLNLSKTILIYTSTFLIHLNLFLLTSTSFQPSSDKVQPQVHGKRQRGQARLDLWLLRSLEYSYSQKHQVLQFLPTKLAEFIHQNLFDLLHLDQMDTAIQRGSVEWYDQILLKCVQKNSGCDDTQLRTFGAIEFHSDLYDGTPRARCYPFKKFHGNHLQVPS
jgi:hypothetical protein